METNTQAPNTQGPVEKPVTRITLGLIISWILGVLFIINGIAAFSSDIISGVLYLVAAVVLLPPINKLMKEKLKFSLSGGLKFVIIIVLMGIIGSRFVGSKIPQFPTSTLPSPTFREITTKTTPPAPSIKVQETPKSYQQVFQLIGNGTKKSEPFNITGDRFKIAYDCTGSYCGAYLMQVGSSLPQVVMNVAGDTKDETIMYGKGEYYLDMNVIGDFTMTVYDYKDELTVETETKLDDSTSVRPAADPSEEMQSYQQVFQLKGSGIKKSEPFSITGKRFKIAYDCTGSYCGGYLKQLGNDLPQVIMNVAGSTKDETIIYGNGEYYIEMNTIGSYTLTVFDYK